MQVSGFRVGCRLCRSRWLSFRAQSGPYAAAGSGHESNDSAEKPPFPLGSIPRFPSPLVSETGVSGTGIQLVGPGILARPHGRPGGPALPESVTYVLTAPTRGSAETRNGKPDTFIVGLASCRNVTQPATHKIRERTDNDKRDPNHGDIVGDPARASSAVQGVARHVFSVT